MQMLAQLDGQVSLSARVEYSVSLIGQSTPHISASLSPSASMSPSASVSPSASPTPMVGVSCTVHDNGDGTWTYTMTVSNDTPADRQQAVYWIGIEEPAWASALAPPNWAGGDSAWDHNESGPPYTTQPDPLDMRTVSRFINLAFLDGFSGWEGVFQFTLNELRPSVGWQIYASEISEAGVYRAELGDPTAFWAYDWGTPITFTQWEYAWDGYIVPTPV